MKKIIYVKEKREVIELSPKYSNNYDNKIGEKERLTKQNDFLPSVIPKNPQYHIIFKLEIRAN